MPPAAPPPPRPPRDWTFAWLALLGVLVVGGLLAWFFAVHRSSPQRRAAPRVVGMQQRPAVAALTRAGYGVLVVLGPSSRPRGVVVTQSASGDRVTLHVSNGKTVRETTTHAGTTTRATTTAAAASAAVPAVVGQDMASGAGQVEAAGFVAETDPASSSQPAGQVVSESPAAGATAAPGSTVVLRVAVPSSRPAVQAPNVLGQQAAAARAALLNAKLTVRTEYRKASRRYTGIVVQQQPAGGASVPAYTQATVVVGS